MQLQDTSAEGSEQPTDAQSEETPQAKEGVVTRNQHANPFSDPVQLFRLLLFSLVFLYSGYLVGLWLRY